MAAMELALTGAVLRSFIVAHPRKGSQSEAEPAAQEVIHEGSEAEAAEDQRGNGGRQENFDCISPNSMVSKEQNGDGQRKRSGQGLGEAPRWRSRMQPRTAGSGAERDVVKSVERIEAGKKCAPQQYGAKHSKEGRRLQHKSEQEHNADNPGLKHERCVLNRAALPGGLP